MIGSGADDPHTDPVLLIPSGKAIDDIDTISSIEVINRSFSINLPDLAQEIYQSMEQKHVSTIQGGLGQGSGR